MASPTGHLLARARAGNEDAFREVTDPYRRELHLHCYRIVGSSQDAEVAEILDSSEAAVKGALQRARATLEVRLPTGGREPAPLPRSRRERELVARFADAVERGHIDSLVSLLTDNAWLTMPPYPFEYQGRTAIAGFLHDRVRLIGVPLRLVPTRANNQPAFGSYLPDTQGAIARSYGLLVLTLKGDYISAITWFADSWVVAHFGLPRMLRDF
jgi:RNA polymerase sigma-70 factor (ECF subfamily)